MFNMPRVVKGDGLRLYCADGSEYLDAISGTFNLPLGYNYPPVVNAVEQQLKRMCHVNSELALPYAEDLLERLLTFAPAGIDAGWMRDATGSTAVECAIKIAQKATGKSDVVSLYRAHHGQTLTAMSISGPAWRRAGLPILPAYGVLRVPEPDCRHCFYRQEYPTCQLLCAERIRDIVQQTGRGSTACLIVEPVLANAGNIVPPEGYFQAVRNVCDELGILLIVDEVQTGLGRTGTFLACERFGIRPDIIVLAKGLGGIGLPIAAVLMLRDLDILAVTDHSFTAGANLLGIAAAQATIDIIGDEAFLSGVRERGAYLRELLTSLTDRRTRVGKVLGVGMMWGLELLDINGRPDPELASAVVTIAREQYHLITRSSEYGRGHVIKIRPALISTRRDLEEIVDRLGSSIDEATRVQTCAPLSLTVLGT